MSFKDTILGWIRTDPDKSDALEDAEIDAADQAYAKEKPDKLLQERFGSMPGEFESDQERPPH